MILDLNHLVGEGEGSEEREGGEMEEGGGKDISTPVSPADDGESGITLK